METYQLLNQSFTAIPCLDYLKAALELSDVDVINSIRSRIPQCNITYGTWALYPNQAPYLQGHLITLNGKRLFIVYAHHNSVGTTFIAATGIEAGLLEHMLSVAFNRGNTYMQDAISNNHTPAHRVTVPMHRITEYHIAVDTIHVPYETIREAMVKYNTDARHSFKTEEVGEIIQGRTFYLGKPDSKFTKIYVYEKGKKHGFTNMSSWVRLETQIVLSKLADQQRAYHTNLPTLLRGSAAFNQVMSDVGIG